jgi:TIR domain/Pentapeptide repeats (8 copies)
MANEEHLAILRQGVKVWNRWKKNYPLYDGIGWVDLDLSGADLRGASLRGADFSTTNLSQSDLSEADLREATLSGVLHETNLSNANLGGAKITAGLNKTNLAGAVLFNTNLNGSSITDVNLSGATMGYTSLCNLDFWSAQGLEDVLHSHPSYIDIQTLYRMGGTVPRSFLRGCGMPDSLIEYLPSLVGATQPIQFYSCFISHSSQDEDFAQRLHSRMRDHHLRVWYAPEDMKGGQKLHEQIDQAIRIHDKLVLVLSEHSIQSEWVMTEIRKARKAELRDNRRKLFPIRLVDMDTLREWECFDADIGKDLAVEVREYFIPDFTRWKDHDSFERAFARFLKDLQAVETPPVPRPAEPPKASGKSKTMPQNPQTIITRKKRRLEVLEEQQAIKGISTPPEVVTEIEDLRREITELEG